MGEAMKDMRAVIVPKSDQLNSDDLLSGPITIKITGVAITPGTEQPVSVSFEGDGGKPWRPCKSMARVMVHCWGPDANEYTGRSLRLYRDPKVLWAGLAVGGIRISHMSDIDRAVTMALTESKKNRKPFTVLPLVEEKAAPPDRRSQINAEVPVKLWDPQPEADQTAWLAPLDEPNGMKWLKNLEILLARAETQDDVVQIGGHASVGTATAKAPEHVQRRISELLATAYARFHEQPSDATSDEEPPWRSAPASKEELPEIVGQDRMGAG